MLSASELAAMRAQQEATMTLACTVKRPSRASDGQGGKTVTKTAVVTTVCRIGAAGRAAQQMIAEKHGSVVGYTVTVPYGTDVTGKDEIEADGRVFEVVGVLRGSYETARRVVCVEVG